MVATTPKPADQTVTRSPELTDEQERAIHLAVSEFMVAEVNGWPPQLAEPTLAGAAEFRVMDDKRGDIGQPGLQGGHHRFVRWRVH